STEHISFTFMPWLATVTGAISWASISGATRTLSWTEPRIDLPSEPCQGGGGKGLDQVADPRRLRSGKKEEKRLIGSGIDLHQTRIASKCCSNLLSILNWHCMEPIHGANQSSRPERVPIQDRTLIEAMEQL